MFMITVLRGMLKSHVYRVFLWVFLAVLIFSGISFDFSDNKPWVIKVYNQKTNELDFRQAISTSQQQYDYLKAQGISWPRTESIEKEVLRHIITSSLLQNIGQELELSTPDRLLQEQLEAQLASLPPYFFDAQGQLNIAMLEKLIAPRSFESLLHEMENEIKASLLYNLISIGSYVPQFEVALQSVEEYADKKYSIIRFSFEKALDRAKGHKASDDVLERFYKKNEHGDLYKTVEKRAGHYWKFSSKHYGLTVSKAEVSTYYNDHKQADYLETPAQVKVHRIFFTHEHEDAKGHAQLIHQELSQNPAKFDEIAKKIAAAKLPSQGSEKTEFFAKDSNKHDKILVDVAFEQLAQDGDVSTVIKTDKGYEILQRVARKSAKYKSLQDVQGHIETKLVEEKFAKRFKQDAERLISNANYNKEGLPSFIEKRKGNKETIHLEAKKSGLIAMQLFQTDQNQYVAFMDGQEGILLQCTDVQKRALKPFAEIKATVSSDYYKKQAEQELHNIAAQAMKDAADMNFEAVAKKYEAHLETAESIYKKDQMDQSAILRRPEIAQKIKNLHRAGTMIDVVTLSESYVIRLDEVATIDENLLKEKKAVIETTLASKAKYKGRDSFIASLYRHAKLNNKIEVKDQLIKDTKDPLL